MDVCRRNNFSGKPLGDLGARNQGSRRGVSSKALLQVLLEEKHPGRQADVDLDYEFPGPKQGHLGSDHCSGVPEEGSFLKVHVSFDSTSLDSSFEKVSLGVRHTSGATVSVSCLRCT